MSTPSEKPTCNCRSVEECGHRTEAEWKAMRAATSAFVASQPRCEHNKRYNHDDCPGPVIATEAQIPASEATATIEAHLQILVAKWNGAYRSGCAHISYKMCTACYADFCEETGDKIVLSLEAFFARRKCDPTPELRDAIKAMKHVRNYAEDGTYFIALSRAQIDAVLSTLGEPK